ncbi:MAG: hypothetical protein A2W85_13370 [Bacteroidetes bacterium GWF2_41_31]|nr:MAG: hypothetical protein A2W85_13370 [Bacteroidetes bacterium GWF2_41_31]OFZ03024.1 MAG: hypothetical protein A2338_04185 [Bacteroidetes bacterium RIFOXYB12_FULL_41_6]
MGQNNNADGVSSIAGGFGSKAIGDYSIGLGYRAIANVQSSFAIGVDVFAGASNSFAIGNYVEVNASKSFVIGRGYDNTHRLINETPSSMMIGFMSTAPTLFISSSDGTLTNLNRTGKVGIGNITAPEAKLHIKADEDENAKIFLQSYVWDNKSIASIFIGTLGHGVSASAVDGLTFNSEKNYLFGAGDVGFGLDLEELPAARLHIKAATAEVASVFIEPAVWDDGTTTGGGLEGTKGALTLSTYGAYLLLGNQLHGIGAKKNAGLIFNTESYYVFNDGYLKIGKDARIGSVLACTDGVGTATWVDATVIGRWLPSGVSDIYYNQGKVGVGTDLPEEMLHVAGTILTEGFKMPQHGIEQGYVLTCDINGKGYWVPNQNQWKEGIGDDIYREFGYVGIGINVPTERLHVSGNIQVDNDIKGHRTSYQPLKILANSSDIDGAAITLAGISDNTGSIKLYARGTAGRIEFHNQNRQIMSIRADDNVYLGDPNNPSDLFVNGEINADLIKVTAPTWYDNVFAPNYQPISLYELELYIKTNSHLPDIPTEQQVKDNGVNVGELNALLLKKIEELTLYVIDLKKENDAIKSDLNKLKNK